MAINENKRRINLIRKILTIVSYKYEGDYWGHDTAMNSEIVEMEALKKLNRFLNDTIRGVTAP